MRTGAGAGATFRGCVDMPAPAPLVRGGWREVFDGARVWKSPSCESWEAGHAVRRDWPDGTHQFVGFRLTEAEAARFLVGDYEYWRKGPMRPIHSLVVISG